jgi:hypothetical protein
LEPDPLSPLAGFGGSKMLLAPSTVRPANCQLAKLTTETSASNSSFVNSPLPFSIVFGLNCFF